MGVSVGVWNRSPPRLVLYLVWNECPFSIGIWEDHLQLAMSKQQYTADSGSAPKEVFMNMSASSKKFCI